MLERPINCVGGTVAIFTDEYIDYPKIAVDKLSAYLNQAGYGTLCIAGRELGDSQTHNRYAASNAIYSVIEHSDVDGLIAMSGSLGHKIDQATLVDFLDRYKIPKVSHGIELDIAPSVIIDDLNGMKQLMDHLLLNDKRQNFAYIRGYPNDPYSIRREKIFRSKLSEQGITINENHFVEGNYDTFETYGAVTELLNSNAQIDVIVAANDLMALSAARAIMAKGLKVPEDISVTGFDDTSEATQISPALTTVRQPIEELANNSSRLLIEAIELYSTHSDPLGRDTEQLVQVQNELVVRGSTKSGASLNGIGNINCADDFSRCLNQTMSGLTSPPDIEIENIVNMYWKTVTTGSSDLSVFFGSVVDTSVVYEFIHWWSNLCDQLETHTADVLNTIGKSEHHPLVLASLAQVRERIWSSSLDNEFERHRLENVQTRMQLQMSSCADLNDILNVYSNWLSDLGASRSFLVRFNQPGPTPSKWSQLLHVYRDNHVERSSNEHFQSKDILPMNFQQELKSGLLVMCPLYAGDTLFGYFLLDPHGLEHLDLETTANSIGNALRNQYMIETLEKQASSLRVANHELYTLAQFDVLTDLPNRHNFQQRLQNQCKLSCENKSRFALLFIDLDGFKYVNDTYGHDAGDHLLQSVSQRLQDIVDNLEYEDIFIARLGGDEFTMIVDLQETASDILKINQSVLESLSNSFTLREQTVSVSASIGCAFYPNDGEDATTLVKHADTAMYHAKRRGRNCIAFYKKTMSLMEQKFHTLDQEIRAALLNDELCMYFQPRVDLESGEIQGIEALMRWPIDSANEPRFHANPNEFIPVAETTGFITQLDIFALHQACKVARKWELSGRPVPIAVNLSVVVLQTSSFVQTVKEIIEHYQLSPHLLELEITESAAMTEVERNVAKLGQLREMGVRIAIDDFGTGYSSLSYLKKLPINYLKIDRSFITDIVSDKDKTVDAAIIQSVVALGKSMGLKLVAEGIETQAQVDFMRKMGCDQAQGFFYAKPQPLKEIEALISDNCLSYKAA